MTELDIAMETLAKEALPCFSQSAPLNLKKFYVRVKARLEGGGDRQCERKQHDQFGMFIAVFLKTSLF